MTTEAALLIAKSITILGMLSTALGQGYLIGKALEAIGRNPEMEGSIFSKMIVGVAMTETTAIFAFVAFFLLKA
jgi:F-type H+-transporting ATPase subunit c